MAFWALASTIFILVHVDGFGETSLVTAFLAALFLLGFAYRDRDLDDVIAAAGALLLAVLATWELSLPANLVDLISYTRAPAKSWFFATAAIATTLLLGGGGFMALPRAVRPGRWAALSAAAPALVLIIAYWRLNALAPDFGWSTLALALAGLELAATVSVARRRNGDIEIDIALGAYAAGVFGGTILAVTLLPASQIDLISSIRIFSTTAVAIVILSAGGCFLALTQVRPGRWAALSAAAPALVLIIAYWRLNALAPDIGWSTLALALAGFEFAAAVSVARRRNGDNEIDIAFGRVFGRCVRGHDPRRDIIAREPGRPDLVDSDFLNHGGNALLSGWPLLVGFRTRVVPGGWAALSAAAPALVLIIAYWRLNALAPDFGWSTLALALAGLEFAAAASVARRRNGDNEIEVALGAYAVGAFGGTILGATFALSTAWQTLALALHLPALGWVEDASACRRCVGSRLELPPRCWCGSC